MRRRKRGVVSEFWVRGGGCSTKFAKVRAYRNLSPAERLLADILRDQPDSVRSGFVSYSQANIDEFIELTRANQLSNFCHDYLLEHQFLADLSVAQRAHLVRYSAQEISFHKRAFENFQALLQSLPVELTQHLLWIKGTALSQTVYRKPSHRVFCDFDVVVRRSNIPQVYNSFAELGFVSHFSPAFCNQIGSGPARSIEDLMLTPHADLIPSSALSLRKDGSPMVDLKFGPFDSGVQGLQIERMFADAVEVQLEKLQIGDLQLGEVQVAELKYRVPSHLD